MDLSHGGHGFFVHRKSAWIGLNLILKYFIWLGLWDDIMYLSLMVCRTFNDRGGR